MICIHADTVVIYNEDKDANCGNVSENSSEHSEGKEVSSESPKNGLKLLTE